MYLIYNFQCWRVSPLSGLSWSYHISSCLSLTLPLLFGQDKWNNSKSKKNLFLVPNSNSSISGGSSLSHIILQHAHSQLEVFRPCFHFKDSSCYRITCCPKNHWLEIFYSNQNMRFWHGTMPSVTLAVLMSILYHQKHYWLLIYQIS